MNILILTLLLAATNSYTEDFIDILFKQTSTYDQREIVSKELKDLLGIEQPLPVIDSIAEVCYQADICAQSTSDSEIEVLCEPVPDDSKFTPQFGSACYLKNFKQNYSCNKSANKMTINGLKSFSKLIDDTSGYYVSLIKEKIIKKYLKEFNIDLNITKDAKEFYKAYPKEAKKLVELARNSIALGSYTSNCYDQLNDNLFRNKKSFITRHFNLYKSILDTLDFFPSFTKKVNRGVNLPEHVLKEHHKIGNIVCYNGFTSSAVHNEKTDYTGEPSNYFLEDTCTQRLYISYEDNGATPGKLIDSGSMFSSEKEVLFSPGACFRIDKVTPRTDKSPDQNDSSTCSEGEHFNFEMTLVSKDLLSM